jgi:hypothetical protein
MRAGLVAGAVLVWAAGTFFGSTFILRAQTQDTSGSATLPDSVVRIAAEADGLSLVSPDQLPESGGTFWIVSGEQSPAPYPFLPARYGPASTPIFLLGANGQFLVDGTANTSGVSAAVLDAQGNMVLDFINQLQAAQANAALRQGRMMTMDDAFPSFPGDGDTNSDDGGGFNANYQSPTFTTNDLWLQIDGLTNDQTGGTAYLTIHPPWNDTNLFHDLYYATSLNPPVQWAFVMRCPYTNAVVPDLCSPVGFFRLGPATNGNLTVSMNATPQQLAQLLVPPWVTVTNATYTGTNLARGTFAGGNGCGLPIDSGVILATGCITNAIGPNNQYDATTPFGINGDSDLDNLVGGGRNYDAAVLEFDIVSTNTFMLQFQYIYASEEYPEFISQYNDPMAIFVSTNRVGTNWINSITNDIALVPGTTNVPVSVNSINGGCLTNAYDTYDSPTNAQYYVDNHDPHPFLAVPPYAVPASVFNIQYDGMTVLLTAQAAISANVTNHVKIAIEDYQDTLFDSAVFIKAWSPCQYQ